MRNVFIWIVFSVGLILAQTNDDGDSRVAANSDETDDDGEVTRRPGPIVSDTEEPSKPTDFFPQSPSTRKPTTSVTTRTTAPTTRTATTGRTSTEQSSSKRGSARQNSGKPPSAKSTQTTPQPTTATPESKPARSSASPMTVSLLEGVTASSATGSDTVSSGLQRINPGNNDTGNNFIAGAVNLPSGMAQTNETSGAATSEKEPVTPWKTIVITVGSVAAGLIALVLLMVCVVRRKTGRPATIRTFWLRRETRANQSERSASDQA